MMNVPVLLFDLDGTLVETTEISISIIQEAIRQYPELPVTDAKTIRSAFGLPKKEFWDLLVPEGDENQRLAIQEEWEKKVITEIHKNNVLMPFAKEVLAELESRGYILSTASNCTSAYLNGVLDSQEIRDYFEQPLCLETVQGHRKEEILIEHFKRLDRENAYMIGDRSTDIEAAHAQGVPAVACHFGYADEKELEAAEHHIHSLRDLLRIFK